MITKLTQLLSSCFSDACNYTILQLLPSLIIPGGRSSLGRYACCTSASAPLCAIVVDLAPCPTARPNFDSLVSLRSTVDRVQVFLPSAPSSSIFVLTRRDAPQNEGLTRCCCVFDRGTLGDRTRRFASSGENCFSRRAIQMGRRTGRQAGEIHRQESGCCLRLSPPPAAARVAKGGGGLTRDNRNTSLNNPPHHLVCVIPSHVVVVFLVKHSLEPQNRSDANAAEMPVSNGPWDVTPTTEDRKLTSRLEERWIWWLSSGSWES